MARFARIISAIDAHTAGEPARIVLSGLPPIRGETMAAKKQYMQEHLDGIRALLMREPRGHRDLFGVILTPSTTAWGQYGVLFIDNAGYIDMCGHGIRSWARSPQARTGNVNLASDDPRLRGSGACALRSIDRSIGEPPCALRCRRTAVRNAGLVSARFPVRSHCLSEGLDESLRDLFDRLGSTAILD
ncbi:MAG: proline racemase family protein [Isosphaeraceae bacterium]